MQRLVCFSIIFCLIYSSCFAQFSSGHLEAYVSPGLFTARFSHGNSMVPQGMQGRTRIGSIVSYGIQYGVPAGKRVSLKAGIGYSTRQYSMVQYRDANILFLFIIPFAPAQPIDSFPISRLQYNNRYVEVPLSFDYNVSRNKAAVQVHFGLNARLQFLASAKIIATPNDQSANFNDPAIVHQAEQRYADDVKKFVFTLEPYMDVSFRIYKGIGVYYRTKPVSLYASTLNHKVTDSQAEFLGSGFGVWYQF